MTIKYRIALITLFSSIFTVVVTRILVLMSIKDYNDYNDLGSMALLTIIFFLVSIFLNTPLFVSLFKSQILLPELPSKMNFLFVFVFCFLISTISVFTFDWLYDVLIESDSSEYYGHLLMQSVKESNELTQNMLLQLPFLAKNLITNLIGLIISWIICTMVVRRSFQKMAAAL